MRTNTQFWLDAWAHTKRRLENEKVSPSRKRSTDTAGVREPQLRLDFVEDHAHAAELLKITKKEYTTPHLSQAHNDLNALNAFWAFLIDETATSDDARVPGVIGVRVDDIPEGGLTEFWYHHYGRMRDTDFGGVIDRSHVPGAARRVYGRCAYVGDYFQDPKSRIDHHAFMLSAFIVAQIRWSPDWTYGFITESGALRGQSYRLGFQHHCRAIHRWIEPPKRRANSDLMVYSHRDDVAEVARIFMSGSETLPAEDNNVFPMASSKSRA